MDISYNNHLHDNFMYYQRNIRDYGDNIREYNQNMTNYLNMIAQQNTNNYPNLSRRNNVANISSPQNVFSPLSLRSLWRYVDLIPEAHLHEDVVVFPSATHIDLATETIQYTRELPHSSCPITLEPFHEGEQICRIIHCGHIFKETSIREWFQRNVRCPVCRYDIRTFSPTNIFPPQISEGEEGDGEEGYGYRDGEGEGGEEKGDDENSEFDDVFPQLNRESPQTTSQTIPTSSSLPTSSSFRTRPSSTSSSSSSSTPITNILTNAVRNFINNELRNIPPSNEMNQLIYTFDIPIDFSGGNYRV